VFCFVFNQEFFMKKSLVALAVLAASGAAFAESGVTLYGLVDTYVGRLDNGTTKQTVINTGGVNTSRWGIKGAEDLGGGLKAIFKLEQGFALDTGANGTSTPSQLPTVTGTQAFDRQSYVGLAGNFGEFQIGKVWTAYDDLIGASDGVFNANVLSVLYATWKSASYIDRPTNGFRYTTPEFSGFTGALSHSLHEKVATAPAVSAASLSYAGGPLAVQLAYQVENPYASPNPSVKYLLVAGSYDFGLATAKLSYGDVKNAGNTAGLDATEYQVALDVPVGANILLSASYARSDDDVSGGGFEQKREGFAVGATYTLSKRTFLYGGYQSVSNQQAVDTTAAVVGIQHRF